MPLTRNGSAKLQPFSRLTKYLRSFLARCNIVKIKIYPYKTRISESAICKPSFIALPDGSGSFTGRQRQRYHCRPVKPKVFIEQ